MKRIRPSGRGNRLRLTILLATVAAFMLVPAAQAFASNSAVVQLAGTGQGEVNSGLFAAGLIFQGSPPIECSNIAGEEKSTCENELRPFQPLALRAKPAEGSEFAGWTIEEGEVLIGCNNGPESEEEIELEEEGYIEAGERVCVFEEEQEVSVTATFNSTGPAGPTNRATLTVTKSAGGSGGTGSVSSKPKGIKCAAACNSALASMYKGTPVTLKEQTLQRLDLHRMDRRLLGRGGNLHGPMAEAEAVGARLRRHLQSDRRTNQR